MRKNTTNSSIQFLGRMTLILLLLVGMFGSLPAGSASADGIIIYVDSSASGADNGSSWADAYTDLQSALLSAPAAGTQVWVAAGTYYPVSNPSNPPTESDKSATFQLLNDVGVYGGFAGTEGALDERDPGVNVTILSGDIGVPSNSNDNIFHVVTSSGTDSTAVLDGFTITEGNATEDDKELNGGGILNVGGSPTISNMVISNNKGIFGGGMFNFDGASPTVTNVTFIGNSAVRAGGMYNNLNTNSILTNVTFVSNSASVRGGGMTTSNSSPTLTNVTFHGNSAPSGGGLHNAFGGNPTLIHVTFSGNSAAENGGSIYNDTSSPVVINSILYNNTEGTQVEIFNVNSTPTVSYSIVEGGFTGTGNLDQDPLLGPLQDNGGFTQTMALGSGSPAIDAGNDASCPAEDQRGFTRPQGAHCDIGAYEADNQAPETTLDGFPPNPDSDNTPTFTFSGDDDGGSGVASFLCRMDGASYVPCTSPFTSAPLSAGSHTFDVYAVDHASNADPTPASHTWTLEFTPTNVTSIVRVDTNPTSASSVDFTVTFSANVTGVDTGDFVLTTNGVKNASVSGVAGTGATYTVTVNTGTRSGTIRLDIPSEADIQDSYGNQPVNLPFTGGEVYTINKGPDTTGVFRPSNGVIFLKNTNTSGFADVALNYGLAGDYPVVGDWDGDGDVTIGVYRNGRFLLRNSNTVGFAEINFLFGSPGDQPIAGDWDGDGDDTIGTFRPSTGLFQLRNSNDAGPADVSFFLGLPGDVAIAGDWNGDGIDTTGVFRPSNGVIFLKNTNATGFADVALNYGLPGDKPVVGDWDDDGDVTIGVFRRGQFLLRNSNTNGFAEIVFSLGFSTDMPIAGNWDGLP
jgi:predicted outer membrane repeat protein